MKLAIALCLSVGCGVSGAPDNDRDGLDNDPSQVGTPEAPAPMQFKTGPYDVVSRVEITAEAVLPSQIELVVATLRQLSVNPARALITIADEAGVPAVATLYSLIPPPIKDRLEGWINDEIAMLTINGMPITDYAGRIAALADFALTEVAVNSTLTIHGDTASHRLTGLDLTPAGVPFQLPIGGLAGDILTQEPGVVIDASNTLSIGDQHFGLNYGEYAWQGVEAVSRAVFGGGVRESLGHAINCPRLAHSVAGKCTLGLCVGHETELTAICEGGLDWIVQLAHDRIAAFRLEALHLAAGQATMIDDDGDGIGDTITDGVWQAELNLGLGLRHTPASFSGGR